MAYCESDNYTEGLFGKSPSLGIFLPEDIQTPKIYGPMPELTVPKRNKENKMGDSYLNHVEILAALEALVPTALSTAISTEVSSLGTLGTSISTEIVAINNLHTAISTMTISIDSLVSTMLLP